MGTKNAKTKGKSFMIPTSDKQTVKKRPQSDGRRKCVDNKKDNVTEGTF
jgi:hypothetical protein